MRKVINFNENWYFDKMAVETPTAISINFDNWESVKLPHTWNAIDGQDGGNDYHRGTCHYAKIIKKDQLPEAEKYYLEINGANSSAEVFLGGKSLAKHDGGYSTWRVDITEEIKDETLLVVAVDNAPNNKVYPQVADFTFYGGLYRDVNLICVEKTHFDLEYFGSCGLKVTPSVEGDSAEVELKSYIANLRCNQTMSFKILDMGGNLVASSTGANPECILTIDNVHLWHGLKDPYLYTAVAEIWEDERLVDSVKADFGCRTFQIDPEKGFILNGEEYPLRGVSRHQDRWSKGNALSHEDHDQDMDLICEMGANTIRLAHYQHDQYFYDLCDKRGQIVWAEIPYISNHMVAGRENTISQMKELVTQNYNHPSIVVWGLSNEITMKNDSDPDLLENHRILNDLVHEMDSTRLTAVAAISSCDIKSPYLQIADVVSYNHYFGWYGGETGMNGPWFDNFHKTYPNIPIGCSEYGCEALNWHTSNPVQGDYTEEYQAYYHEELIKQFFSRKYLWATHVWNMFDFGADARSEGGENGLNHKGLVTMDRKYKKDSFYAYKAWLSNEPFVHICGKRYVDRVEDVTKVTVYSNLPEVELFANGVSLGKVAAEDHFFYFNVPNQGETVLKAVAEDCTDESKICKVEVFNEAYRLVEKNAILNWFDITEIEGRFSLNDKVGDIMSTLGGKLVCLWLLRKLKKRHSKESNQNSGKKAGKKSKDASKKDEGFMGGFQPNKSLLQIIGSFTVLRLTGMMGMFGITLTKEDLLDLNSKLNKVKKPKKLR